MALERSREDMVFREEELEAEVARLEARVVELEAVVEEIQAYAKGNTEVVEGMYRKLKELWGMGGVYGS